MNLKENEKDNIRNLIEEMLKKVPEGQRIKLQKNVLEELIFFVFEVEGEKHQVPVWTGDFLRKIDLSELDFGVETKMITHFDIDDVVSYYEEILPAAVLEFLKKQRRVIDFSYTNIDAKKLYQSMSTWPTVGNCNFEGVDLSNITLYPNDFVSDYEILRMLDFETTGLQISEGNNFRNSGLRIETTNEEQNQRLLQLFQLDEIDESKLVDVINYILQEIKKGTFDGCYVNGHLVQNGKLPIPDEELFPQNQNKRKK